jgi:hypothetical protein
MEYDFNTVYNRIIPTLWKYDFVENAANPLMFRPFKSPI